MQNNYKSGEYIVRQGAAGDTFFIIKKGRVSSKYFFIALYVITISLSWLHKKSHFHTTWILITQASCKKIFIENIFSYPVNEYLQVPRPGYEKPYLMCMSSIVFLIQYMM